MGVQLGFFKLHEAALLVAPDADAFCAELARLACASAMDATATMWLQTAADPALLDDIRCAPTLAALSVCEVASLNISSFHIWPQSSAVSLLDHCVTRLLTVCSWAEARSLELGSLAPCQARLERARRFAEALLEDGTGAEPIAEEGFARVLALFGSRGAGLKPRTLVDLVAEKQQTAAAAGLAQLCEALEPLQPELCALLHIGAAELFLPQTRDAKASEQCELGGVAPPKLRAVFQLFCEQGPAAESDCAEAAAECDAALPTMDENGIARLVLALHTVLQPQPRLASDSATGPVQGAPHVAAEARALFLRAMEFEADGSDRVGLEAFVTAVGSRWLAAAWGAALAPPVRDGALAKAAVAAALDEAALEEGFEVVPDGLAPVSDAKGGNGGAYIGDNGSDSKNGFAELAHDFSLEARPLLLEEVVVLGVQAGRKEVAAGEFFPHALYEVQVGSRQMAFSAHSVVLA
eukprot:SAG11_NODE_1547_length_4713_cov_12.995232_2_plen_466_part_00